MPKEKSSRKRPSGEVRSKRWCVTLHAEKGAEFKSPIDEMDHIFQRWTTFCHRTNPIGSVASMERGEDSGKLHIQAAIEFQHQRSRDALIKYCSGIHLEKPQYWDEWVEYCQKEETHLDGPWFFPHDGTIISMKRWEVRDPLEGKVWHPWQEALKAYVIDDEIALDREIIWIYDTIGGVGKSMFLKHLSLKHNDAVQYCGGACFKDVACLLKFRINPPQVKGRKRERPKPPPKVLTFDIPRAEYNQINYGDVERLKNGHFVAGKYESAEVMMNNPAVLIFANSPPQMLVSPDRWAVFQITNGRLVAENIGGAGPADHPLLDLQEDFVEGDVARGAKLEAMCDDLIDLTGDD